MRRIALALCLLAMTFSGVSCSSYEKPAAVSPITGPAPEIAWKSWSDDVFTVAAKEHKFVLLDLGAVWCHWCHVMDETTYRDPDVRRLLASKYIAVYVDQDSRPDLANRYEEYGWPATIVFDPNHKEIVKRRGYLPPQMMASMLQAIIDDPTPGPSAMGAAVIIKPADSASLGAARRKELIERIRGAFEPEISAWAGDQKFIDPETVEFCLSSGDQELQRIALASLAALRQLIDPVWGGVYQYSTDGDWVHPHFEKIMSYQAGDMSVEAVAYLVSGDPARLQDAQDIHRFLQKFLTSPQGAFYVSQDADVIPGEHSAAYFAMDDAGRRKIGVPRVDTHLYARENGWAIRSLVTLYEATGDEKTLEEALAAANWIVAYRALPGGGFRHGDADAAGPYLGDTLAMGRAFLALYEATADHKWLGRATAADSFIAAHFAKGAAGLSTAAPSSSDVVPSRPEASENIAAARFANLLHAYTGDPADKAVAERAMKYASAPEAVRRGWAVGGLLLADQELGSEPLHITIVGSKSDPRSKALYLIAIAAPSSSRRVEWLDQKEGPLPRGDVEYPTLDTPAAFICTGTSCSSPMTDPAKLRAKLGLNR